MRRLTDAQKRCLSSVAAGTVHMHFDVYGGYQWQEKEYQTGWRKSELLAPAPIKRLVSLDLIEFGHTDRPYSGRRIHTYRITDAGRAALDASRPLPLQETEK